MSYIIENGKTFYDWGNGLFTRANDDNFKGMRFNHKRCPFCNKITSMHPLHWLNHIKPCSGKKYYNNTFLELRYIALNKIEKYKLFEQ